MKITKNLALCALCLSLCGCGSLQHLGGHVLETTMTGLKQSVSAALTDESAKTEIPAAGEDATAVETTVDESTSPGDERRNETDPDRDR